MTKSSHNDAIFGYLKSQYGIDQSEIDSGTLLFTEGFLDSFSMVDLVTWIENTFNIRFGVLDINLDNLDSVDKISAYLASRGA